MRKYTSEERPALKDVFSERLQIIRKEKGYSQNELADMLDVSQPTVSSYEQAASMPSIEKLMVLCTSLGVSADYFLGLSNHSEIISPEKSGMLERYEKMSQEERKLFCECIEMFSKHDRE